MHRYNQYQFVSVAKVLGIIAILIPGFPGIKEWAYAGLSFDLVGATFSIYSSGERGANLVFMLMPILSGALSYLYYRRNKPYLKTNLTLHDQH